jgi:cyclopropane-fatty-acyl-phospholipid synthase
MLLAPKVFKDYGAKSELRVAKPFEFGISYADTLLEWRNNFERAQKSVIQMGFDEKFMRMWNLYLSYCEGAFRAGRIDVGHYQLSK